MKFPLDDPDVLSDITSDKHPSSVSCQNVIKQIVTISNTFLQTKTSFVIMLTVFETRMFLQVKI